MWTQALDRLDAKRSTAFATRDPRLLHQVYVPGPLLTSDAELLNRIVPVGCKLLGARTTFTGVHVVAHSDSAMITTTASLAPSTLTCNGHRRGTAPGAGPTGLRLVLRRTLGDVRISDERTA